ncbi:amino acid/amide ABC transporter substrate-binding protein, HAAT family [Nocardia amikacinitolerans]|uniref:Amino acid/amide ABC transporter substrate-binding protein, HAAT family n=1 Tax=Nocardia amikacinitolerans TaxID=756689 RepID=A0A285LY11_9NOCA|nr:amino acid/amide ABC transporter substrate-binding protein, HAAT family [Nocardia amikacinitolerans]MCP2292455.1 amino acid/amide ABC transporter substrate-binding protein, HAAT family [Nocardia amikacinitolerans]MCP2299283.1 amino acid/amide ABC transporter substrate-binding protein, HAAT family [Nocardia amikacinitolerans]SNY89745.1 amino acid/amide ABC transporter substrate-binding protein, HAAT family [Nocardia amikacinitolerans]
MLSSTWRSRSTRGVLVIGAAAALALTGCSDKSTDSGSDATGAGTGGLSIQPVMQVDTAGKEVPKTDPAKAADPAGDGKATCAPGTAVAMAGALTGPDAALGINIVNGVKLALDQHNKANPGCKIELKQFDTEGDPQKATQVIPQIVNDKSIIGLVGPAFSGETKATGQILSDAGLVAVTSSATNATLTQNGWTTFFRGLANDDVQGPSVAKYLVGTANYKKVCVVQDNTDYGVGLAKSVTEGLGAAADPACAASIKKGDKDFSATVTKIAAAAPDAVFFSGYYAEGAPLAQQLKSGGVKAVFVGPDGVNDPQFISQAGSAAKGANLTCPCGPAPEKFAKDYEALNGQAPGVYSVEAYDLTTILAKGIDGGKVTRPDLLEFVRSYDGPGLARNYKWSPNGELANAQIWIYEVK